MIILFWGKKGEGSRQFYMNSRLRKKMKEIKENDIEKQAVRTPLIKRILAMMGVIIICGLFLVTTVMEIIGHPKANAMLMLLLIVVVGMLPLIYLITTVPKHIAEIFVRLKGDDRKF